MIGIGRMRPAVGAPLGQSAAPGAVWPWVLGATVLAAVAWLPSAVARADERQRREEAFQRQWLRIDEL